jgi:8-oxo-dGTP pyrophosphatase MutT (NUDIX family)
MAQFGSGLAAATPLEHVFYSIRRQAATGGHTPAVLQLGLGQAALSKPLWMNAKLKGKAMQGVYYRSAGGVVYWDGQILLLDRPSRREIRLPKGHIESEESDADAALREVTEETGYACLEIVADLGTLRVEFRDAYKHRDVQRDERFFLMFLKANGKVKAKQPEAQFLPRWVPSDEACEHLTFEAEREFVRRALRWLEQHL